VKRRSKSTASKRSVKFVFDGLEAIADLMGSAVEPAEEQCSEVHPKKKTLDCPILILYYIFL
jgi:hypothetical protein